MSNETSEGLKRLSWLPDRDDSLNGDLIAGQEYNDVYFDGGSIANVILTDVTINGTETARNERVVTASGPVTVASDDYIITINKTIPEITTVTLPASPSTSRSLIIKDGQGEAGDFNITLDGNGKTIDSVSTFVLLADWQSVEIVYNGTEWNVLSAYKVDGDVIGPVLSTDNSIARFDGTSGRVIQSSAVTIADTTGVFTGASIDTAAAANVLKVNGTSLTAVTGTGAVVLASSPVLTTPNLGTPSTLVGTNITGTAASFTAGSVTTNANLTGDVTSVGNATTLTNAPVIAKVLTGYVSGAGTISASDSILSAIQKLNGNDAINANLTGPITSVGNATSIASQTGTGSKFVVDTSPTLVTPNIGTPSAGVLTNCTGTAAGLTAGNVTTNANLTGAITSVGNATSLGSFTSAALATALTDETGSGANVFATSPTLVTPYLGFASAANINLDNSGAIRAGTVAANYADLQAYDVDGAAYRTWARLTSGNTTTFDIYGTVDANAAPAGVVGEFIEAEVLVGSQVAMTTGTDHNIASISLTAGDWDVWGNFVANPAATTVLTLAETAISQVSATKPTKPGKGAYALWRGSSTALDIVLPTGTTRININATTTIYLIGRAIFTTSTCGGYGYIAARRRR